MTLRYFVIIFILLNHTACALRLQPGFTERDQYVINTPEFPDNRVYYVKTKPDDRSTSELNKSLDLYGDQSLEYIKHREPLSIVANSVTFPYNNEEIGRTRDIVVLLEVKTDANKSSEPIVVWYQRGVHSGQSLNFANLLIFAQSSYDNKVAPFFRIRVVDVQTENNTETRELLSQVSKFGGGAALAFSNPSLSPILATASKAASLVLANRTNKMLLDYTVQFYPEDIVINNGNPNLTPFLKGRFLLVGRSKDQLGDDKYWENVKQYDELNLKVIDSGSSKSNSPVVTLQVLNKELTVLPIVALRTAYLTKLLNEGASEQLGEIQNIADDLSNRLKVFAWIESARKYHSISDLQSITGLSLDNEPTDSDKNKKPLAADLNDQIMRFMHKITGCNKSSVKDYDNIVGDSKVVFMKEADANNKDVLLERTDKQNICTYTPSL